MNDLRIAWLVPTAWFYWQPSLSELTQLFPQTKVFTGLFPGFAKGFDQALNIVIIGGRKVVSVTKSDTSYGNNFTYLSPSIVYPLLKFSPQLIFSSSFGIWTILALVFKFIRRWHVVIAYEGSSPGVDYRNSLPRLLLRRWMVRTADACITNSQAGKDYLIEVLHANADRVFARPYEVPDVRSISEINETLEFVENTVDLRFVDLKKPSFIFIGSLVPRKGVKDLLEACRILKEQGIKNFSVLIIGDGEQRLELESFTQIHDLQDCVVWVGSVDYSNIGTYFYHADVFVLPTLEDTWGMVILEAMLLGKPVLASTGAGASELVINGRNGYRFPANDPKSLAESMSKFIKDPDSVKQMGYNSKQLMEQYSPQSAAEFMAEIVDLIARS